jgi:nucleotide-binding universal stress UspA family protein
MNYKHVIVPLDGSELAESVLPHLEAVLSSDHVDSVELVRVVPPLEMHYKAALPIDSNQEKQIQATAIKEAEDYLKKFIAKLDDSKMSITTRVLSGNVADVLADYINRSDADLLILATHGRSGPSRWIWGSIAERLLHSCCIPTFIVHPPSCSIKK